MEFEFDADKSASNKGKHGIDFVEAQALWRDRRGVIARVPFEEERRYILIGKIGGKHWTAVFTRRNGRIRIISVRRSRHSERHSYDSEDTNG